MITAFLVLTRRWDVFAPGVSSGTYIASALLASVELSFEVGLLAWVFA